MDLVLPMGWVRSPPFFCTASETAADLDNGYMADHHLPTPEYGPTSGFYSNVPSPPTSVSQLQVTDVYMDDLNCLAQGNITQQRRVTEMVLQGIKGIFPSLPDKIKDSVSIKKSQQGDGDWAVQK